MNKVILMGRLTSDPKMDWTRSEDSKQYATYTLAVNRRFKRNGEQEADFINCVAWGAMAEFAEKFMKKGAMFAVEGRLNVRSWEKDGERHWTTTVVVENCYFTGSKRGWGFAVLRRDKHDKKRSSGIFETSFYGDRKSLEPIMGIIGRT